MNAPTDDKYDEETGRAYYSRWKQVGGAKPQWLENAILNDGARLEGWEVYFFKAFLEGQGDKQDKGKGPPLPHPGPPEGKGKPDGAGRKKQGELGLPGDGQPAVPPFPLQRAAEDLVLPDE